jgi:hypothetical protein
MVIAKALNEQPDGSLGADAQKANALLIAAMRNALPALIAEIRQLRAERLCLIQELSDDDD